MRFLNVLSLALVAALSSAPAWSADFSVSPTRAEISQKKPVETLTLTSNEDRDIYFEVNLLKWSQNNGGEWVTVPSKDLVATPALVKMPARGKGLLRVGFKPGEKPEFKAPAVEGTYRLIVRETEGPPAAPGVSRVQVLTEVNLPVFIQPAQPKADVKIASGTRSAQGVKLALTNAGNVRLQPQAVKAEFQDASGKAVAPEAVDESGGSYVLAGSSANWSLKWPTPAVCKAATQVKVTFETTKTSVVVPLSGSCL
jgi:fimbrial chaperone protein